MATGTLASLTPYPIWQSNYAHNVRKNLNNRPFDEAQLRLMLAESEDIFFFYQPLCCVAKPAEIDLCPISFFDAAHAL